MDISLSSKSLTFIGPSGSLQAPGDDLLTLRLAMLMEGQCELGATDASKKYGLSRQRYYQLLHLYKELGAQGLQAQSPGPKSNYRRTDSLVRLVIRHRFIDPDASAHVIRQKLRQEGRKISLRSIERIIADFGLQKKTLRA